MIFIYIPFFLVVVFIVVILNFLRTRVTYCSLNVIYDNRHGFHFGYLYFESAIKGALITCAKYLPVFIFIVHYTVRGMVILTHICHISTLLASTKGMTLIFCSRVIATKNQNSSGANTRILAYTRCYSFNFI